MNDRRAAFPRRAGRGPRPRGILFDLDGTLIDSRRDIATAVNAVRAELGVGDLDLATVSGMVGEGARTLLERALPPLSAEAFEAAFRRFLEHYDRVCVDTTVLYAGMPELLDAAAARAPLAVLTNKPERSSRKILAALGVAARFTAVVGGDTLDVRKPDPQTVRATAARLGLAAEEVTLVGDSLIDAQTANAAGCGLCLVTWGFRARAELAAEWADVLCDDVGVLRRRLGV